MSLFVTWRKKYDCIAPCVPFLGERLAGTNCFMILLVPCMQKWFYQEVWITYFKNNLLQGAM